MWPVPRGRIRRIASCVPWITARRLISSWRVMLASDSASSGVIGMIPALLTRMSIGPRRRSTSSRKALKPARSVTSSGSPTTASPSSAAVRSAASRSTSPIATRTPLAISACVIALPMPLAPPVTTAVLPLSERGCLAMVCPFLLR